VRRRTWLNLLACALLGWWCIPWGLGTPLVIIQNLKAALVPQSQKRSRALLTQVLDNLGIALADVELGPDGLTAEQRGHVERLHAVLHAAIHADGSAHAAELEFAGQVLASGYGGTITLDDAVARLRRPPAGAPRLDATEYDQRIGLLELALGVLAADGKLAPAELAFVRDIGRRLAIPPAVVDRTAQRILFGRPDEVEADADDEYGIACATLGVARGANVAEIRRRYREQIVRHHPDVAGRHGLDPQQAGEITQRLNWAYDVLKRQAAVAA
jgi:uncharacterized tellurite resistance protein B-like protein